ncbi:hypothetical protein C8R47DRAFT_1329545 [Mycena vitilis]|nr:hypothetical protein C8R47DRAFT_1329545 [Mycena vitilis]
MSSLIDATAANTEDDSSVLVASSHDTPATPNGSILSPFRLPRSASCEGLIEGAFTDGAPVTADLGSTAGDSDTAPAAPDSHAATNSDAAVAPAVNRMKPRSVGPWEAGYVYSVVPPEHLAAVPVTNDEIWYCILVGKFVGVTQNNLLALKAVQGISNNSMRSWATLDLALDTFNDALDGDLVEVRLY